MKYQDIYDSGRTTTVVTGLDKYSEYSFQVLAYTVQEGPLSEEIKATTKEDGILNHAVLLHQFEMS